MNISEVWTPALALVSLPVGKVRVFKSGRHQVALFRPTEDDIYAVDNRCPHEGYPLAQGYVKGCVLTCAWHNFKFDLRDGTCLMGDENLTTWPVRIRDGQVEICLREVDRQADRPRHMASLKTALVDYRPGQVAREVARLLELGEDPVELCFQAAAWDAQYAEYGTTHTLPLATDILRFLPRYQGLRATLPLAQLFEVAADPSRRSHPRQVPDVEDVTGDAAATGEEIRRRVEAEESTRAEALLRGALARGWGRAEMEPWFFELCADHFLDFGHALIYQIKMVDLLERVGWHRAVEVLPAYLHSIAVGTREDTLPYMAGYRRRLAQNGDEFPRWYEGLGRRPLPREERDHAVLSLLDGETSDAFAAMVNLLERGTPGEEICDVLTLAAAQRMLRFNWAIDLNPGIQNDWLSVSHLLTFANAVRQAFHRWKSPVVLRFFLQATRFINDARTLDLEPEARGGISRVGTGLLPEVRLKLLSGALLHHHEDVAMGVVQAWLEEGQPLDMLRDFLQDVGLSDSATRSIVVAHIIKTTVAAWDEFDTLGGNSDAYPVLLAVVRLAASPRRERRITQVATEAIRFVGEGLTPHKLAE